jgi:hypothetical protein
MNKCDLLTYSRYVPPPSEEQPPRQIQVIPLQHKHVAELNSIHPIDFAVPPSLHLIHYIPAHMYANEPYLYKPKFIHLLARAKARGLH